MPSAVNPTENVASGASRWRLVGDGVLRAEGDTQILALDSVAVAVTVPPVLTAGDHTLRLVVDTLGVVVETQEANNAVSQALTVVSGSGTVGVPGAGPPPRALTLSNAYPSPGGGTVSFDLELPRAARVGFSVHDLQGRRVWAWPERAYEAGRRTLAWDGRTVSGAMAATGIYVARVEVEGLIFVRRVARLR